MIGDFYGILIIAYQMTYSVNKIHTAHFNEIIKSGSGLTAKAPAVPIPFAAQRHNKAVMIAQGEVISPVLLEIIGLVCHEIVE